MRAESFYTFSWPYGEEGSRKPRGGTTVGPKLELAKKPNHTWDDLQEPGLDKFEKDRRAILALQGAYRASFDFLETVIFSKELKLDKPYQSWGTEYIYLLDDLGDFISLQHVMTMSFVAEDGKLSGPHVMKHWRQDWQFQDTELIEFKGHNTWKKRKLESSAAKGAWSQAVYHVDDSPRYEVLGKWRHHKNVSYWTSREFMRPLPRREYSVRSDYDGLLGNNRITILPLGWTHEQENKKAVINKKLQVQKFLAFEKGFNRYQEIVGYDFSAGDEYWQRTKPYWEQVRKVWQEVFNANATVSLKKKSLFMSHFSYADGVNRSRPYSEEELYQKAEQIISDNLSKNN